MLEAIAWFLSISGIRANSACEAMQTVDFIGARTTQPLAAKRRRNQ
jgi:hypothetical protein